VHHRAVGVHEAAGGARGGTRGVGGHHGTVPPIEGGELRRLGQVVGLDDVGVGDWENEERGFCSAVAFLVFWMVDECVG
jgi:hypothetical protein